MKIAQVVCVYPPYKSGIGNVAEKFREISRRHGHESCVITPEYGGREAGQAAPVGERGIIRVKPYLKYGNGAFIPQLFFILDGFDIVHLHYPFFGGAEPVWLKKMLGAKFRLAIHYHMDTAGLSLSARVLGLPSTVIMHSLFKRAEAITCASLDYVNNGSIKTIYRRYARKFHEIPFGVDSDKFNAKDHIDHRQSHPDSLRILFVGALDAAHYFKGMEILLEAVSMLKTIDYRLSIVGDGDKRPGYEALADKLGIGDRVEFLGRVADDNLPVCYAEADLFVLPSINRHEAFGLVLLEAMASSVPVIASGLPGVRKVFDDGEHGLFVLPGDAADLAAKIEKLSADAGMRRKMGAAGRKLAEEKYDWNKIGERLMGLYRGL